MTEPNEPAASASPVTMTKKRKSRILEWTEALLVAFIAVMVFRVFFFEAYTIPSSSMEKSLLKGDYILVSKVSYGARVPMTALSVPFFHQKLSEHYNAFLDWIRIPYIRLPGFSDVKAGDVVVFNTPQELEFPVDQRTYYIKRCAAVAGDTFEIRNAGTILNGKEWPCPINAEAEYIVKTDSNLLEPSRLAALHVTDVKSTPVSGHYLVELTREAADSIRCWNNVISVIRNSPAKEQKDDDLFPNTGHFHWNLDHFGPLIIPRKGMSVSISADSLPLYRKIIADYEHNSVEIRHDSVYINNVYSRSYTFRMNYYFMMGDNRHYSLDSRYWGFVPEDHIVGKAILILASVDKENKTWRWDRLFRNVK